jgi:hypothetical protein
MCAFTFPKTVPKAISPRVPSGIGPLTSRVDPPCQREALNDTNKLLVIDREECFLLVGDTDSRWSVFAGLVDLIRHCKQDYKQVLKQSMLPKCFGKVGCPATFSVYENKAFTRIENWLVGSMSDLAIFHQLRRQASSGVPLLKSTLRRHCSNSVLPVAQLLF